MGGGPHDITVESVDDRGVGFPPTCSCALPPGGDTNESSKNASDDGSSNGSMAGSSFSSEQMNEASTWEEDSTTNSDRESKWSGKGPEYHRPPICSRDNSIAALKRLINNSLQKLTRMNGPGWHHGLHANGVTMQGKQPKGVLPMAHTNINGERKKGINEKKNTQKKYYTQKKTNRGKNKKEANYPALDVQSIIRNMEKAIKNGELIQSINRSLFRQSSEERMAHNRHTQVHTPTRRYQAVNKLKERPNRNGVNSTGGKAECRPRAQQNRQSSHPTNYKRHLVTEGKSCPLGEVQCGEPPMQNNFPHTRGQLSKMNWTPGHNRVQRCGERGELFEPSMTAPRHLLLISAEAAHEWDDYHRVVSYATPPLHPPHDGCTVSRRREEVYTKGFPWCGGRNYNHMAQKGVDETDKISTHLEGMEFRIRAPINIACPHSYVMREEEKFLFRSVDRGFSQVSDHNWRGVTRKGIHTWGTNFGKNFAPNGLPNGLHQAQFSSQHGCLLKKCLSGEGTAAAAAPPPPHDAHTDVQSKERTSIHSKMKRNSNEENKTMNELITIHKLVKDMQNVQLVIKELTDTTLLSSGHTGVSNHRDPNTTEHEQAHSDGGNIISLFSPPAHGGPSKKSSTYDGNDSNNHLSSGDVQKYEEKIANLVQELMNTKLLLAQSETKREEDINEMNRRCGS
ncbi:hypothetical protein AK88_01189 [Plasmodium fragile]|uniref:Uncharacterized protein n=1 Tax=Plasmodium fragile TaxID=5857 RepID=A0A0D9QQB6_PLAFR|nr:uncharacterized protein AK88_01189 [Plasmodium fragile]KJP89103.1 hypothetical protein AK88_01189 [Plasmodium fragile]